MKLMTIFEGFVSNLTNLSSKELEDLFNKEYSSHIKVLHSSFVKLNKTTDAVYYIVSYDNEEKEYLINEMTVVSKQKGSKFELKMSDHSAIPIDTAKSLTSAKALVTKMSRAK